MTLYADDPDVYVRDEITDALGNNLTFTPVVKADDGTTLTATWEGTAGPKRVLRTSLVGLAAGQHRLRLVVPGGPDVTLANVYLS